MASTSSHYWYSQNGLKLTSLVSKKVRYWFLNGRQLDSNEVTQWYLENGYDPDSDNNQVDNFLDLFVDKFG